MYVYMYICIYIYIYIYVYIYIYTYKYVYIYIHVSVCIYIYIYEFGFIYRSTCRSGWTSSRRTGTAGSGWRPPRFKCCILSFRATVLFQCMCFICLYN